MKDIENLKLYIAKVLKEVEVEGIEIQKYQNKPDKFVKLPAITYLLTNEMFNMGFREIKDQIGIFQVDIWANTQKDISSIRKEVINKMITNGIHYMGGRDFEDPSGIKRFICNFKVKI